MYSTYHGNQPRGYVKTGVFACQNCRNSRSPLVHVQRIAEALVSNDDRDEDTEAATQRNYVSQEGLAALPQLTFLIVLR